jgi:uncharacterized protein
MTQYHEPVNELKSEDRNIVRALASLKEEIEAVDWYHQRAASAEDDDLKSILIHNRDEEIEHAAMILEWLRRTIPAFDDELRTYLFTDEPITGIEEDDDKSSVNQGLGMGSMKS